MVAVPLIVANLAGDWEPRCVIRTDFGGRMEYHDQGGLTAYGREAGRQARSETIQPDRERPSADPCGDLRPGARPRLNVSCAPRLKECKLGYRGTFARFGAMVDLWSWRDLARQHPMSGMLQPLPLGSPASRRTDARSRRARAPLCRRLCVITLGLACALELGSPVFAQQPAPPAVANATSFAGADIGAQINAAIRSLPLDGPNHAGTVAIPAGQYTFATTIIKPKGVELRGEGALASVLTYTGPSEAIVVGDTAGEFGQPPYWQSGLESFTLKGPGRAPGSIGIWLGGDPAGSVLPTDATAQSEHFNQLVITGFDHAVQWGDETTNTHWLQDILWGNNVGIVGVGDSSNSTNVFSECQFFANVGGAIIETKSGNELDLQFSLCDFEFNNPSLPTDGAPTKIPQISLAGDDFTCFSCHFEEYDGPFFKLGPDDSHIILLGGQMNADATGGTLTDPYFIYAGGGQNRGDNGDFLNIEGVYFNTAHAVAQVVDFANGPHSANSVLRIEALPYYVSGGENRIHILTTAVPTQGTWVNDLQNTPADQLGAPLIFSGRSRTDKKLGEYEGDSDIPLAAETASLPARTLRAGSCVDWDVGVTGAAVGMVAMVSPDGDPGRGLVWQAWVSGVGWVRIRVCNVSNRSVTSGRGRYAVRVIR